MFGTREVKIPCVLFPLKRELKMKTEGGLCLAGAWALHIQPPPHPSPSCLSDKEAFLLT